MLIAQSNQKSAPQDLDKDGRVTREEIKEFSTKEFEANDKDADGSLSPEEFTSSFARFDLDSNGKITEAELVEVRVFQFDVLDQDSDGAWSEEEIRNPKPKPMTPQQAFARYDTNKDDQISEEEYRVFFSRDFKSIDKDNDGSASTAEFTDSVVFPRIDADQNNNISESEYLDFRIRQFRGLDTDHNDFLTIEEQK